MKILRPLVRDESGVALIMVLLVVTLLIAVAVTLPALVLSNQSRSNAAVTTNNSLQAAESGLNVYLADLTEDSGFYLDYIAAGEARRTYNGTQYPTTAGANSNANVALSPSWSRTASWTYPSDITTDPGWRTVGSTSYQYLLEIFPDPNHANNVRVIAIGRPTPSAGNPASNTANYRAVETFLTSLSISDFQMLSASSISYGSGATTTGWVYATDNNSGTAATITYQSGAHADANLFTENTSSSCSGCTTALVSPSRLYASNSSPTIRTVINEPITFSALQQSPQIVAAGGGPGAIQLDAASSGVTLTPTSNIPDAWYLKFLPQTTNNLQVYSCVQTSTTNGSTTTYYGVDYKKPACISSSTPYATYTVSPTTNTEVYTTEDVIVSGTVEGKVTIYTAGGGQASAGAKAVAAGDIIIGDNISYATPGSDVLGLVANQNVVIACWEPETNLSWTAATISLNGVWASDPAINGSCSMSDNTMTFTGSTATYGGGSMAGFSGTHTYNYDSTLRYLPPPDYPQIPAAFKVMYARQIGVP